MTAPRSFADAVVDTMLDTTGLNNPTPIPNGTSPAQICQSTFANASSARPVAKKKPAQIATVFSPKRLVNGPIAPPCIAALMMPSTKNTIPMSRGPFWNKSLTQSGKIDSMSDIAV